MSNLQKPWPLSRKTPWQLVSVFIILAAGLFTLSRVFYVTQVRHARLFQESELATVANLKAAQLSNWRNERLALAAAIAENKFNVRSAENLIKDPASEDIRKGFMDVLAVVQKSFPFVWAALVLPGGKVLLAYPQDVKITSTPESLALGRAAWQGRKSLLGTVAPDGTTGERSIELMIPLIPSDGEMPPPIALLRMSFDAATMLDPILADWPDHRPTSEAVLLERVGNDFVYLSRPRMHAGSTLPDPHPIAAFRRPASKADLGEEGIVEGKDYRGRDVIAFIKSVPDSTWLVEIKTDLAGLTSGMTWKYMTQFGIALAFLLFCGALLRLFWLRTLAAQEDAERTKWDQANKNMDEFMRQMINIMPNPAFFKDTQGIYQGTNPAFERLLGRSRSEIIGKTIRDVAPEEIVRKHQEHDQALLAKPGHEVYEAPLQAGDGEHRVIFIKSTYERPDGTIGGIIGILKDITQRLRAEEELEQLRKFSDSTVQTMTEGLVLTDSEGKFSFINPAAALMLGYTPSEMVDREVASFLPKDQQARLRKVDEERAKGVSGRYELDFLHKDGSRRTILVSGGPRVQGTQFGGTLAVLTDITDRKAMEEEIKALSLRDELTTLYNRRGFLTLAEQQLKIASRLKKRIAILYLDMDNLKRINDTGGHKLGDRALSEIAFILKKSFREADVVGRLGGDEFSVLAMETTKPLGAETLTQRLRERLDLFNSRSSAEAGFALSVSVGVFTREPDHPATIEEMLSRADLLMYDEKRRKKSGQPEKPPGPSK